MKDSGAIRDSGSSAALTVLDAVDLGCERDERHLFAGVSFQLKAGDMLRIHGPNGSGKSSLLRLLCGLAQPFAGHVELFGQKLSRPGGDIGSKVLWIGHAAGVKSLLTVEENLNWLGAMHVRAATAAISQALAVVGLRGFDDTPCHALSAGQQRRVALARLYLPNTPALWLLDEPFTALDAAGTAQLESHLATHCMRGGTVVLTTHHELTERTKAYVDLDLARYTA